MDIVFYFILSFLLKVYIRFYSGFQKNNHYTIKSISVRHSLNDNIPIFPWFKFC